MNQSVSVIKGVGPRFTEQLESMGIFVVEDLLMHFPFRYEDYAIRPITEAQHDERVTVRGVVHSEPILQFYGKNKSRLTVRFLVDGVLVQAIFFNQTYLKKQIILGEPIVVTGKFDRNRLMITSGTIMGEKKGVEEGLVPVYSVKGEVKIANLRKVVKEAFTQLGDEIREILPSQLLMTYKLLNRKDTIYQLHFPSTTASLKQAKRRMIYEELLLFQLKMQIFRKKEREAIGGKEKLFALEKIEEFVDRLPFTLTGAQDRVLKEILADIKEPFIMNRLLQGDVGSGKTIIAATALYANKLAGFQGALMVPTEILAEQHLESLKPMLEENGIQVALLVGSTKTKERKDIVEKLASGEMDVIIGTHTLIQEAIQFSKLGLAIIDEQHRFGVEQRRVLRKKGMNPDLLFMTATPIPRTLAISAFGDMDVSTIDEMPKGRKPVDTRWGKPEMLHSVIDFMKKKLAQGQQAYVICPLIEESDKLDVQNAIDAHQQLTLALPEFKIGLMHGRLSAVEKEEVMNQFAAKEVNLLVSTTVVEVGVNVPNATVMVIYDAERFGLAQLHQLRGRVGRGDIQSYCILLADPKSEVGKERMEIMTSTTNGFELSERDLQLRGPGDFFGAKQSGLPVFKVADIVEDYRVLEVARQDAVKLVNSKTFWLSDDYASLRKELENQGLFKEGKLD